MLLYAALLSYLASVAVAVPQLPSRSRTLFSEPAKTFPGPEKNFTGIFVSPNSKRMIYYHEQTIAVVELGPQRMLLNCELLEVKTVQDRLMALKSLKYIKPQLKISFKHILEVEQQCQMLPRLSGYISQSATSNGLFDPSIIHGVVPGTMWCGRGDVARTYHDLGNFEAPDRCCRTHDMCPVKVSGQSTQYNITNYSIVTRSHCDCDEMFYNCLKSAGSPVGDIMGALYFNVADLYCAEDVTATVGHKDMRFRPNRMRY